MDIPKLAKGELVPTSVIEMQLHEAKEEALRRKQFRHDWCIALFSGVTGAIFGLVASVVFWLITK